MTEKKRSLLCQYQLSGSGCARTFLLEWDREGATAYLCKSQAVIVKCDSLTVDGNTEIGRSPLVARLIHHSIAKLSDSSSIYYLTFNKK